ncbi:SusC/RagA family TonB-linked outer membrane protein [Owenweeksia hongkongensis]|uniref:SusC/RagA family TonB-linked outer membrane protein n=1 Tax=Owenweeksia hongkongensis TaxID=253245 RepID=UPI003A959C2B
MKKLLQILLLITCFTVCYEPLNAQGTKTISGVITSPTDGLPLPGAAVVVKGSEAATITDANGAFTIQASPDAILEVSFIGHKTQQVSVSGRTQINISLEEETSVLEQVVVVGYGTQKKSHVTGSVSKAEGSEMAQIAVPRADQALVGKLAGVQVTNTSAEAGAAPTIQVRGLTSISASTSPLIVIDGYPIQGDLSTIDMNDVESIEVLKDAASASIYGSRGANGVILVTTKSGGSSYGAKPATFTFNSYVGVKTPIKQEIYPSSDEWSNYVRSNLSQMGLTTVPDEIVQMDNLGTNTDWEDVMMRNGLIQNYSLGVSGGTQGVNYYIGGSYIGDEGVLRTNDYDKYNLRVNIDSKLNDWVEVGVNINPSMSKQQILGVGLHDALRSQPWLPEYHTSETVQYAAAAGYDVQVGDIAHERHFSDVNGVNLQLTSNNSSLAKVDGRTRTSQYFSNIANAYAKVKLTKSLSFRTSFGTFNSSAQNEYFQESWSIRTEATEGTYSEDKIFDWLSENTLTFDKSFGDHDLNVLGGFSAQKTTYSNTSLAANSFLTDQISTLNAGIISSGSTFEEQSSLASLFSRVNYSYKNKYMVSLSARGDGSSKFGINNQWGFFPSASLGWRVSQEDFFKPLTNTINEFKLRATVGKTGNNGIPNYAAYGTLTPVNSINNNTIEQGFAQTSTSNPDLSWESTTETNFGIDMAFMENRLYFSFDYYIAETDQLLLLVPISAVTGFTEEYQNIGKMKNTGFDFEVNFVAIDNDKFTWRIGGNISHYRNELLDFAGVDQLISTPDEKRPSQYIAQVGSPLVQFYGYETASQISTSDLATPYWPVNVGADAVYVKDLNGDGVITDEDRTVLGSPIPDFVWGITTSMNYKAFDLSMVWQGSQGAEVFNIDPYYYESQWKGANTLTADEQAKTRLKVETDDMIQDASFTALRSLNIGYTLPKTWTKKAGVRVYFTGYNLLYFTADDYTSYNPEGVNLFNDNPLTMGYQRGAAPQYRSYALGLNLNF